VLELFESIRKDARHQGATPLDQRTIARRSYPNWSMALMQWDERTRAIFRSFSPGKNLDLYASDPTTAGAQASNCQQGSEASNFRTRWTDAPCCLPTDSTDHAVQSRSRGPMLQPKRSPARFAGTTGGRARQVFRCLVGSDGAWKNCQQPCSYRIVHFHTIGNQTVVLQSR
ncbi:MAG: hypothetical protein EOP06_23495, partial [Proteobacteria bacterium]